MTRATELADAIEQRLRGITTANGFATGITAVYGFGERVPDKAPMPYLLVRLTDDSIEQFVGTAVARTAQYQIEGVFPRLATLQDMQRCHHDILRAIGTGQLPHVRPVNAGWPFEESAEFDPDQNGSSARRLISSISLRYVEHY